VEVSSSNLAQLLEGVRRGEFISTCRQIPPTFEPRKGVASVTVFSEGDSVTLFERGTWLSVHSREEITYTNTLRFRFFQKSRKIALEHLRYGKNRPVLLFELEQVGPFTYRSLLPHMCKEDTYTGSVLFDQHYIHLDWQVVGPKKNTSLRAVYIKG